MVEKNMQNAQVFHEIVYDHEKGIQNPRINRIAVVMDKLRGGDWERGM